MLVISSEDLLPVVVVAETEERLERMLEVVLKSPAKSENHFETFNMV